MKKTGLLRGCVIKPSLWCYALVLFSVPLQAHSIPPIALGQAAVLAVSAAAIVPVAGSTCTVFTYDKNGNRLTQVAAAIPTGSSTWGSAPYGCFVWHS